MKKSILFFAVIANIGFIACNNETKSTNETGKAEKKDTVHARNTDSLGMKMGGNELDSKKK